MAQRKPRPPKIPRPKVKELRKLYKGLNNQSQTMRIEALKLILQWYDQAMPYVEQRVPSDLERAKLKEKIFKLRRYEHPGSTESNSASLGNERETAFRVAVSTFETYAKILRPYPIAKVLPKIDRGLASKQDRAKRLEQKFAGVLNMLSILKPTTDDGRPIRLTVESKMNSDRKFGYRNQELLYSRAQIKRCQVKMRREGVLAMLFEELLPLSRAAALGPDQHTCNDKLRVHKIFEMLKHALAYFQTPQAPRRLVRFGSNAAASTSDSSPGEKAPQARRQTRGKAFGKRLLVDGLFAEGSATAILYQALKDEQWHSAVDLQKLVSSDVKNRLRVVGEKVETIGYCILNDSGSVRMCKQVKA